MKKRIFSFALALAFCLSALLGIACLTGCSSAPAMKDRNVLLDEEFGGVYVACAIDDFNALGFAYGDSVDVSFSNGYELKDLPYYNGYYTKTGEPLVVAYPSYPYVKVCINNGDSLWMEANLKDGDRATIRLAERGKYLEIQYARDITYKNDPFYFPSDEAFANFRAVKVGKIKDQTLYRSASPCDNTYYRASTVDKLIQAAGVRYILDLADNDVKIAGYRNAPDFQSPYFSSLYDGGFVKPLALNMNYGSAEFREKVADGLSYMSDAEGPYLVHCTEGKDRTGFVCMLLEMLCGASYEEIVDDYMITYDNYYFITKESDEPRYNTLIENLLVPMMQSVVGELDPRTADLAGSAEAYLRSAGMESETISRLKSLLTES